MLKRLCKLIGTKNKGKTNEDFNMATLKMCVLRGNSITYIHQREDRESSVFSEYQLNFRVKYGKAT